MLYKEFIKEVLKSADVEVIKSGQDTALMEVFLNSQNLLHALVKDGKVFNHNGIEEDNVESLKEAMDMRYDILLDLYFQYLELVEVGNSKANFKFSL